MRAYKRDSECCAKPIKGAMNQPSKTSNVASIKNAVVVQAKAQGLAQIKGTMNGPKAM